MEDSSGSLVVARAARAVMRLADRGTSPQRGSVTGRRRRAVWIGAIATVALTVGTVSLSEAHDFWIIPHAFSAPLDARLAVRGQTSSLFPSSVSAVTPDRIAEARVLTADRDVAISDFRVDGTSLILGHRPAGAGQHVIGVRIAPRNVRESPASFRRYLDLEGAPEARLRYEREGRLPPVGGDSITRRYAKYAKTFVEVGTGRRAFARTLGHPLEIVPLSDPGALRRGDTLRLRLVMLGKPATAAKLHAGSVPQATALADTVAARRAAAGDVSVETDGTGTVAIPLRSAGLWNVRTIQIVPAEKGSGADWDVHWATITFVVKNR